MALRNFRGIRGFRGFRNFRGGFGVDGRSRNFRGFRGFRGFRKPDPNLEERGSGRVTRAGFRGGCGSKWPESKLSRLSRGFAGEVVLPCVDDTGGIGGI